MQYSTLAHRDRSVLLLEQWALHQQCGLSALRGGCCVDDEAALVGVVAGHVLDQVPHVHSQGLHEDASPVLLRQEQVPYGVVCCPITCTYKIQLSQLYASLQITGK